MVVAYRGFVEGKVQGVCFRASMLEMAQKNEVGGWVKNLDDGRVEFIVSGNRDNVNRVLLWCLEGPKHATVERVEIAKHDVQIESQAFTILRH